MKQLLFIDFETFHHSKGGYDLRKMSMVEYARHPKFKIHGVGTCTESSDPVWNDPPWKYGDLSEFTIVAHNAKFDGFILCEQLKIAPAGWIDTKAMAKAVLGKTIKGYSLRELAEHFGFKSKGQLKTDGLDVLTPAQGKELAEYCLHDVELCRQIYFELAQDFPASQYEMMDWTVRSFVQPKLRLNTALLEEAAIKESARRSEIIASTGIDKSVFSSNPKFAALLKEKGYEVPTKKSPRTGGEIPALALGDVGFIEMRGKRDGGTLGQLCDARVAAKSSLLETRAAKLAQIGKTGPWPFDVEFSGATQTHRFSGGSGAGGNPQNFTRGSVLREAVEAPEGHSLVVGDFSNIELRLVAYLSKDPGLVQAIEQGKDLYCDFASAFYGRTITKSDKSERQFGKTAILGLGYGMGAAKFKNTVRVQTGQDISQDDAERAVNLYRRRYIRVPALWKSLHEDIQSLETPSRYGKAVGPVQFGYKAIILPSGLIVRYTDLRRDGKEWVFDVWKKKGEKEQVRLYGGKVLENICQSLAGELCKEAALPFKEHLTGLVHDEIHLCVPTGIAQMKMYALKAAMEKSPSWLPEMKLNAEVKVGKSWLGAK